MLNVVIFPNPAPAEEKKQKKKISPCLGGTLPSRRTPPLTPTSAITQIRILSNQRDGMCTNGKPAISRIRVNLMPPVSKQCHPECSRHPKKIDILPEN